MNRPRYHSGPYVKKTERRKNKKKGPFRRPSGPGPGGLSVWLLVTLPRSCGAKRDLRSQRDKPKEQGINLAEPNRDTL